MIVLIMSNLLKFEFVALYIFGKNYLSYIIKGLGDIIVEENEVSSQDKTKNVIFLHHLLDGIVEVEYLTMKDPLNCG